MFISNGNKLSARRSCVIENSSAGLYNFAVLWNYNGFSKLHFKQQVHQPVISVPESTGLSRII